MKSAALSLSASVALLLTPRLAPADPAISDPDGVPGPDAGSTATASTGRASTGTASLDLFVVGSARELETLRASVVFDSTAGPVIPRVRWQRVSKFSAQVVLQRQRSGTRDSLRCWIDLTDPKRTRLYFARGNAERFLIRTLDSSRPLTEMEREAIGQVIEMSVAVLREDAAAGLSREDVRAFIESEAGRAGVDPSQQVSTTAPSRSDDTTQSSATGLDVHSADSATRAGERAWDESPEGRRPGARAQLALAGVYSVQAWMVEGPVTHGPGLELGYKPWRAAAGAAEQFSFWGWGRYAFEQTYGDQAAAVGLQVTSLGGAVQFEPRALVLPFDGQHVSFGLRMGLGAARVGQTPAIAEPEVGELQLEDSRSRTEFYWSSLAFAELNMDSWACRLGTFVDGSFHSVQYELAIDQTRSVVAESRAIKPGLWLALGLNFGG